MDENLKYRAVGVMSGTSLDGLDIVLCHFIENNNQWSFQVVKAATFEYTQEWKEKLSRAQDLSALQFVELHHQYGAYIGKKVKLFLGDDYSADFIASHGHTVFHMPERDITFQIGCGAYIAANSGLNAVSDFRILDIAFGGQGAPLVPVGDVMLFHHYDGCINLGGFANISFQNEGEVMAYDICPVNFILNEYIQKINGDAFDKWGETGRKGHVVKPLLEALNELSFYHQSGPKSLAREWVEQVFNPVLEKYGELSDLDVLHTCYHHFAIQVAAIINKNNLRNVLVTGGGAFNTFLIELISEKSKGTIVVPDKQIVDFKEAIVFAFLGVLRMENHPNCLRSVTGAKKDNIGGSVFVSN